MGGSSAKHDDFALCDPFVKTGAKSMRKVLMDPNPHFCCLENVDTIVYSYFAITQWCLEQQREPTIVTQPIYRRQAILAQRQCIHSDNSNSSNNSSLRFHFPRELLMAILLAMQAVRTELPSQHRISATFQPARFLRIAMVGEGAGMRHLVSFRFSSFSSCCS
jgi:hypothetical protein